MQSVEFTDFRNSASRYLAMVENQGGGPCRFSEAASWLGKSSRNR
jgi:hypothetical protein